MTRIKKGFTLLELVLVLGVGAAVSFIKFQDLKNEQESIIAEATGQQIKQIGEAVNRYISIRYDKLSTLSAAAGSGMDPGPRTCSVSGCQITYQTLINEGLLPSSHSGLNIQSSGYNIYLKRDGLAPNYVINGLVTTLNSWSEAGKIRYDLLGQAMQSAGIDSGMTKSNTQADGYNGQWAESSANYSGINKAGLLAYRVGYDSSLYSVYLRRDGTLPMTGNLNMGGNDINNAKNITASGTGDFGGNIDSGGTITAAGEVFAHNGYGDTIAIGGDAAADDYEIRMSAAKPLSIFSPNVASSLRATTTVFKTNGQMQVIGNQLVNNNIATNGLSYTDMPSGWQGLRTNDVVAGGTIAVKKSGTAGTAGDIAVYFNQYGNLYASNSINSSGTISASGNITSGETVSARYLKSTQIVVGGQSCSENGLLARDSAGQVLSCVSNIWQPEMPVGSPVPWPSLALPAGWLECNGQAFNKAAYPLLARAYPSGYLPDLRGQFIRGLDHGRGRDSGRAILSEQRASVVTGTDDNWGDNDVGVLHGPSSVYSRDSINIYDYSTGSGGQDPKYWVHFGGGTGPAMGQTIGLNAGDIKLSNNGSNGFYGGARPTNTAFIYMVRAM